MTTPAFDFEAAIRLFDETTGALASQVQRLEEVLARKQAELVETNARLTEQAEARERLASWLNLVMGSIASGVVAVDRHGVVTTCNDAACDLLRGVLPDLIDSDYVVACPDSPLAAVLRDGQATGPGERTVRAVDGGKRILRARASPLRADDGTLLGGVEVIDDLTELRALEERAQRADRLKQLGEMAAGVAHEIRNPLNGIEGFASLLARDLATALPGDDRLGRYARAIVDGVRNLNRTVTDLLEYTKPRRIERRELDPAALAREVVDLVRAEGLTVDVAVDNRWRDGRVKVDGISLKQVLLNLVQNAVHAVIEAGVAAPRTVLTVLSDGDGALVYRIDDNGPGVPDSERQRIFTPFFTTRDQGTGLGLAIAHTVVALHGGSIVVEDSPLGGARFTVVLPRSIP